MNGPAALVSAGIGAVFFTAASMFYYQPAFIHSDQVMDKIFTTNQSKARAAVVRLLHDPASAKFDVMRSVEVEAAKYVCGSVNAKSATGSYSGNRAFVYTVSNDFARIDDDGEIAQRHAAFKACPLSEEEERIARQKLVIPPGAIAMAKKIQQAMPAADESVLTSLSAQASAGQLPGGAGGQALRQAVGTPGASGGQPGSSGAQSGSTVSTTVPQEAWRIDRPPQAWPVFSPDHPLAKPAKPQTPAEALMLAKGVETRWAQFKAGDAKQRPSVDEIQEARRALLAIHPKHETFPQAWAAFVRLETIEREALT